MTPHINTDQPRRPSRLIRWWRSVWRTERAIEWQIRESGSPAYRLTTTEQEASS